MPELNEELLHYLWQHRLFKPVPFISSSGNEIRVIKPGQLNTNAGPDFFNASIKVNGLILAGNIELHVKSSDWLKHGHQRDASYDNIILHAVYEHDCELEQNLANAVEVLELKNLIEERTLSVYRELLARKSKIACYSQLPDAGDFHFTSWVERMTVERLENKVARIKVLHELFKGNFSQTFYFLLLRHFGFGVNNAAFELLAAQLPLNLLLKHSNNLGQLEAMLLGVSGLLEEPFKAPYLRNLQNEFEFLRKKYALIPLQKKLFKFSRMRPANFPTLRLAQFAAFVNNSPKLLLNPEKGVSYHYLISHLCVTPSSYWKEHYTADGKAVDNISGLGISSAENIIINVFAPFIFFYSRKTAMPEYEQKAIELLEKCRFEDNIKSRAYAPKRKLLNNAAQSQGLLHLHDNYCVPKQCLKCGIAASLLNPGIKNNNP